jgi:hypothetical protein
MPFVKCQDATPITFGSICNTFSVSFSVKVWVFHDKLTSDSTGNFPPVPRQSYHRFHGKLSTFGGCGGMSGQFAVEQSELVGMAKF